MIVEELLTLPPWVDFEGIHFEFQLVNDGGKEMRLGYAIHYVSDDSPHKSFHKEWSSWKNKLSDPIDPPTQGFLVLFEGIQSDVDLCWSARQCWLWLVQRDLIDFTLPGMPGI